MSEVSIPANFKTSLPPRKRAKTKEEKEQRRIERILRNRKAAHASREKKRRHVEFLESYVVDLEKQMHLVKLLNEELLGNYTGGNSTVDELLKKIAALPDLKESKRQHAHDIENVGEYQCSNDVDMETDTAANLPNTPESHTVSSDAVKSEYEQDVVPQLSPSRQDSISEPSENGSPAFISPQATPLSKDRFSLDIISDVPQSISMESMISIPFNDAFMKKEDEFILQIPDTTTTTTVSGDKLGLDDYRVNTNDNEFDFVELRNPAVIAVEALNIVPQVLKLTEGWRSHYLCVL